VSTVRLLPSCVFLADAELTAVDVAAILALFVWVGEHAVPVAPGQFTTFVCVTRNV
jgi:hypothetical protein